MATNEQTQEQLDAVLDAALDNLDDDDDDDDLEPQSASQQNYSRPIQGPMPPPPVDAMAGIENMMKDLMQGDLGEGGGGQADQFLGRLLQEMQSQIGVELEHIDGTGTAPNNTNTNNSRPVPSQPKQASSPPKPQQSATSSSGESDVDQAISSLMEGMANQAKLDEPNMATMNGSEDDMLKSMMDQIGGGLGGGVDADFNADALIDGMMEQLLAKDLMYEPMKKVSEKFPEWLEQNKGKVPQEEYENRCQQYQCFKKLVHTYDTEPENVQLLMQLMQEVQEFGQPPPEIVKDIAPGLELDADGLPKMDGVAGLPFPGGDEDCRIM